MDGIARGAALDRGNFPRHIRQIQQTFNQQEE